MHTLWITFIYQPIYNTLVFLAQYITMHDVGLAVILLTILIRIILLPLSKKMVISQYKMRALQPKLQAIKERGLDKQAEAKETMELYKTEKMNPFSGCLFLLVQLPILFGLYYVLRSGINQPEHLYSFLSTNNLHNMLFGILDITKPFLPFAILAGLTQGIQAFLVPQQQTNSSDVSFQGQLAKSMSMQTRYILPLIIILIASKLAAAVAIYWVVTNTFSIFQELYFRKKFTSKVEVL
ncbi:MAG: YidC/Oxa1 family membrane protein insertase [bacterium]